MSEQAKTAKTEEKTDFTIEEAAEYLGKSVRTIERWKLPHTLKTIRGRDWIDREVRIFSKVVLDEAKQPKETVKHIPGIMKAENQNETVTREDLKEFASFLISGFQNQVKQLAPAQPETMKKKQQISDFKDKLILNFGQAVKYSGLPKEELLEALETKQVLAKMSEHTNKLDKVSHTYRINRQSLDDFCKEYGKHF